jgi:FKBP-type peptidyl-prolyl cis-trans isomerase
MRKNLTTVFCTSFALITALPACTKNAEELKTTAATAVTNAATTEHMATTAVVSQSSVKALAIKDEKKGSGAVAKSGKVVTVHYTGWLEENGKRGKKFDSSVDRGQPFRFTLGAGQVIPGWDQGLEGMKSGGKREITIPPELAYGAQGAGSAVPPNSALIFEVELKDVQ